jgi:hypothetical protein
MPTWLAPPYERGDPTPGADRADRHRRTDPHGAAPVTLTLVRQRAWPTAETIVRLTVTAVFAYLLALLIPSTPRPVLAPLTALLTVQASIYQTLRSAVRRARRPGPWAPRYCG